ncbi:hypothetical protein CKA32_005631 [Geitlerinema sp. FC II]|nr:hypothetical protein CKA32_005631 [Geitlerinema sp. FC II]
MLDYSIPSSQQLYRATEIDRGRLGDFCNGDRTFPLSPPDKAYFVYLVTITTFKFL